MVDEYVSGRFRLERRILKGDPKKGTPDLWQASDAGDLYYVKAWRKPSGDASDVKAMWNREVRSLMRLQSYPGAGELFVRLHHLDDDEKHYYAVLDGGRRLLLSQMLENRRLYDWMQNLFEVGRRRPLWEGMLRVAEALSILHREGTIHRSFSTASIFSGPEGKGDFRLSGFEWSIRVAGTDGGSGRPSQGNVLRAPELETGEYSAATDWHDFGIALAELFGLPQKNFKKISAFRDAINKLSTLNNAEKEVILQILHENPEHRLADDTSVVQALRDVVRNLNVATSGAGRSAILAVRLGAEVKLSQAIERATQGKVPTSDINGQHKWLVNDLRGDIRIVARPTPFPHYVLRGEHLEYKMREWNVDGNSTWNIGFCETAESCPHFTNDDQSYSLGERSLEVLKLPEVRRNFRAIRDRGTSWDKLFPFKVSKATLEPYLRDLHDFFSITQQLDTALTIAQIVPVELISYDRSLNDTEIEVTPKTEGDRDTLAQQLGLASPAQQLKEWLKLGAESVAVDDEDDPDRDEYALLTRRTLVSDSGSETDWYFSGAEPRESGPIYRFRTQGHPPVAPGTYYLAKNYGGTIAQIRRRFKAIEQMRSHESLLRTLANPVQMSRVRNEEPPPPRVPLELDQSKIDALNGVWQIQPLFAVQGPPGTGKTTLIKAFSDRLFAYDSSSQVLVTAHSHHTVDDVMKKVDEMFGDLPQRERPILVRLGSSATDAKSVPAITNKLLKDLMGSDMVSRAPDFIKERLAEVTIEGEGTSIPANDVRTMQLLIQDAANISFSTLNSSDLADLAARGRRFDWAVIEEAGKAHGFDMAAALELSHRLLLIGDHFQLPPYNAKLFERLLSEPLRVRLAIRSAGKFAPTLVDASLVDDDEEREPFEERCHRWEKMVRLFGTIFSTSLHAETGRARPAATLTDQHRMHPDIASIVGRIFYPDEASYDGTILKSPFETVSRFASDPPFSIRPDSWLPKPRVVWCDVPWIQRTEFAEGEKEGLFTSPIEARAVVDVLKSIEPIPGVDCSIQILSPYTNQLAEIRTMVEAARKRGELDHMFQPPFDLLLEKRLGASVDEFQGSEADVIIVSLVRNNGLPPWRSLGFLKEENRMNVLLSRAKHKLIIVGSWQFFNTRCDEQTAPDTEYRYVGNMMSVLARAKADGILAKVDAPK
ncbi:AAA domain-containing protein [Sinorhizobium fredii]|uniref:AAA domain-containing protein n=1 Tax=Rhizobium fredii TaxID=380 RepID=UPI0035162548